MSDDLNSPAFWTAYLGGLLERDLPRNLDALETWADPVPALFGITEDAEREMRESLFRTEAKQAFVPDEQDAELRAEAERVLAGTQEEELRKQVYRHIGWLLRGPPPRRIVLALPGSWSWVIEFDPTPGISHGLEHPSLANTLPVAHVDPHHRLPGLRYSEAQALAGAVLNLSPVHASLLLLPVCSPGPEHQVQEVQAWIRALWQSSGVVPPEHLDEVLRRTAIPSYCSWRHEPELGWVNDSVHSYRNPLEYAGEEWHQDNGFEVFRRFLTEATARD
jgi:hypothetical protein